MDLTRQNNLTLFISFINILIFNLICLIFLLFHITPNLLFIISANIIVFISSFFTFNYIINKFITERMEYISKTIDKYKMTSNIITYETDTNEENEKEISDKAEEQTRTIEDMKRMEIYRREFIGNVSHELKTPIFNIQGYILTLLDGGIEDQSINKQYLERAEKSIDRMIAIVKDIETISRLESGEIEMNYEKFDIVSLTKEVFEFLEIKAKKKNIKLLFDKSNYRPVYVFADKDKINQVLTNLIDNSINYGKTSGTTKVSFSDLGETTLIEVTDNGVGIEQHHITRIFERFFRIEKSRSRENGGTGLGLAIVKHIIEAHKQTIKVKSSLGAGTTFVFTLGKKISP